MFRVALRGVFSRKVRLALTALSVALGVAFVAGSYVLTDTMTYAFTSLFSKTGDKVDVYVQSPSRYSKEQLSWQGADRSPVPETLVDSVRLTSGVKAAAGEVQGFAQIVGRNGKAVSTTGAPTLGVSAPGDPSLSSVTMRQGRLPVSGTEVALDAHTAKAQGFRIGEEIKILFSGSTGAFRLVGTFGFDDVDSMAGATVASFDLHTAQTVLDRRAVYDRIAVKALPGWSQDRLRDSVAASIRGNWEVITGQAQSDRTLQAVKDSMGFFSNAMLVFAGIAVFVGGFLIFNTFSILVAQRTREFGLLRSLGASVGQVVLAIILEALAIGVLASLIGLALGAGIAVLLTGAMNAIGFELPPAPLQYQPRTFVVAVAVGVGVTVVAALAPALRTRRLSPIGALQSGLRAERRHNVRRRLVLGVPAFVVGIGLMAGSVTNRTGQGVLLFMVGVLAVFLGAAALSAFLIRPLATAVGWPLVRAFRLPARLGLRNATRSPARTARTAAALMIGVALISFVSILGSSMKASAGAAIDDMLTADYIIMPTSQGGGFSPEVAQAIRRIPGVSAVADLRVGYFEHDGELQGVGGSDANAMLATAKVNVLSGDLRRIDTEGVAMGKTVAERYGVKVGDTFVMTFDRTGPQRIPVVAVYDDASGSIGEFLLGLGTFGANYSTQLDSVAMVRVAPNADSAAVSAAVTKAVAPFPNVKVQDHSTFRADVLKQVDQLMSMLYVLLTLAVVIALLGIVNTLALSTMERIRELGLLRAVGMTRREVRAMVRHEAVIVAVIGAVFGLVIGVGFAALALVGMHDHGLGVASYPAAQLAIFLVLSGAAGVLAAVLPARRAARVDMLAAIATT